MNIIQKLFDEDIENIHKVLLSDKVWYDVVALDVMGHFGEKPQYFSLSTQVDEKDKEHGIVAVSRRICGKVSEIKLIDVEYS